MNDVIFEALVTEAQFRVAEHTIRGVGLDEAIREVAGEMELVREEVDELTTRVKKSPRPQEVVEDDLDGDSSPPDRDDEGSDVEPNSIVFSSPDVETAVGVLMYKGIPWNTRTSTSLVFDNVDDVARAKEALNRRWDFINADQRTVATIEFDNLEDYQKVLDFIGSRKMTVLTNGAGQELDEDHDVETARLDKLHRQARKDAKDQGLPSPEEPRSEMSFSALRKDRDEGVERMDPATDPRVRNIRVSKRWK